MVGVGVRGFGFFWRVEGGLHVVYKRKQEASLLPSSPRPRAARNPAADNRPPTERTKSDRRQKTANPARLTAAPEYNSSPLATTSQHRPEKQEKTEDPKRQQSAKRRPPRRSRSNASQSLASQLRHSLFNNSRSRFVRAILLQLRELTNPEPP